MRQFAFGIRLGFFEPDRFEDRNGAVRAAWERLPVGAPFYTCEMVASGREDAYGNEIIVPTCIWSDHVPRELEMDRMRQRMNR